jgi:two-component system, sporulation sensor kinase B
MRDFNQLRTLKPYYAIVSVIMTLVFLGWILAYTRLDSIGLSFYSHGVVIIIITVLLIVFPKYESKYLRLLLVSFCSTYFYMLFLFYPSTFTTFIFICLIPGLAILFHHRGLFYWLLIGNIVFFHILLFYIYYNDQGLQYPYIHDDIIGACFNFLGSQAMLYFIFYFSQTRVEQQKMYYEQMQQTERLKTTGELAAAVAHEIRNPITVVKGLLYLHREGEDFAHKKNEHFSLMLNELETAETVISDFLSLAKPQNAEKELIHVKEALLNVIDLLNSYALMDTIDISLNIEEDVFISCTLIEFKQLFINLLKNAIEASNHGDTINISVSKRKNLVDIIVKDSGKGMTQNEVDTLGTPFYSLKSKGTGLGLMICFNIVKKYKGTISFHSEKDIGTVVSVTFPSKKTVA